MNMKTHKYQTADMGSDFAGKLLATESLKLCQKT